LLPIWHKPIFICFYPLTEQKEINTEYILQILSGKDKEIVVSKSDFATVEI
jgi:5-formyltetrahydrofolate cyclo-ligase